MFNILVETGMLIAAAAVSVSQEVVGGVKRAVLVAKLGKTEMAKILADNKAKVEKSREDYGKFLSYSGTIIVDPGFYQGREFDDCKNEIVNFTPAGKGTSLTGSVTLSDGSTREFYVSSVDEETSEVRFRLKQSEEDRRVTSDNISADRKAAAAAARAARLAH